MKYLLLISCSSRKHELNNVRAIDLYDGTIHRIVKKYRIPNLDIYIISSKFGLISPDKVISIYDDKMDKEKALKHKPVITEKLKKILENKYDEIFINLGKIYMLSIDKDILKNEKVIYAEGGIGYKAQQTKRWLENINKTKNLDLSDFS
jgi:hypothetical protein